MGGTGSGRWRGHTARLTPDQLEESRSVWWSWVLDSAYIDGEWRITKDAKTIHAWRDGEMVQLDLPDGSFRALWTPQPRGGRRWWWQCATCEGRVGVLYRKSPHMWLWRCRCCLNLTYSSSNESDSHPRAFWERMVRGQVPTITHANALTYVDAMLRAVAWAEQRYAHDLARAERKGVLKPARRRRRKRKT